MLLARITIALCFLALLAVPLMVRPEAPPAADGDTPRLIIISPHNEQIRSEFGRGFERWHEEEFGQPVQVIWSSPGGTSEIRAMLQAQFEAALRDGRPVGGTADLVFGGGSYEFDQQLKRGVRVEIDGEPRPVSILEPIDFDPAWLDQIYGENRVGDVHLYDPERYWFGAALSGFGIVYNREVLEELEVPEPAQWADLADPRLTGWVALVNPLQSGSITTTFDTILQRLGWGRGWQILRRAAANARYFSADSKRPPLDVTQGDAAMGMCIDFYGRFQSQVVRDARGSDRIGYVDPPGQTTIDPDPIAMIAGAPSLDPDTGWPELELPKRFVQFVLSERGQSLWQFSREDDRGDLGPERFELRRLPVRRSMYAKYSERMIDEVNPFKISTPIEAPIPDARSFVPLVFAALAMDVHEELEAAWEAIITHPDYPRPAPGTSAPMVTAADVTDPALQQMLELFDAMPTVPGPDGAEYSLATADSLATVKAGWLRGGWAEAGLWHPQADPPDELRRRFAAFFRTNYRQIVEMAQEEHASRVARTTN